MEERSKQEFKSWLFNECRQNIWWIIISTLISLPSIFFMLVNPLPLKWLTDFLANGSLRLPIFGILPKSTFIIVVLGIFLGITLFGSLYNIYSGKVVMLITNYINKKITADQISTILHKTSRFDENHTVGETVYSIDNQTSQLPDLLITDIVTIIKSAGIVVGVLVVIIAISGFGALALTFTMILFIGSFGFFGIKIKKQRAVLENESAAYESKLNSSLLYKKLLQVFLRFDFVNKLTVLLDSKQKDAVKLSVTYRKLVGVNEIVIALSITSIIYLTITSRSGLSAGNVVLLISYMYYFFDPLSSIIETIGSINSKLVAIRKAFDLTADKTDSFDNLSGTKILTDYLQPISFQNIHMNAKGKTIFDGMNLIVNPLSITLLIGESGVGKSTIFDLLLRRREPQFGQITIGSTDIREINVYSLWRNIVLSSQDMHFMEGTIRQIISFGDEGRQLNDPDIIGAAALSGIDQFINDQEKKFDQLMSEKNISEGQIQRLALARAVYTKAPVILLDEPVSALDFQLRQHVVHNLRYLKGTHTVIIISHDNEVLDIADTIYNIKNNGVITQVTKEEARQLM